MRNSPEPAFFPCLYGIQYLVDHVQIQLVDQSRVLQCRDEISRGQYTFYRIYPSGQCLRIAYPLIDCTDDWLGINLNPFFLDCPVDILYDILPFPGIFTQVLAVVLHGRFISAA